MLVDSFQTGVLQYHNKLIDATYFEFPKMVIAVQIGKTSHPFYPFALPSLQIIPILRDCCGSFLLTHKFIVEIGQK